MSVGSRFAVTHEDTMVGPLSPNMQLGDESMLTTLDKLGYPGPALMVMREMLPTPFDWELAEINQRFLENWQNNECWVAEFTSHSKDCDVKFKLEFQPYWSVGHGRMTLSIGYRAYDNMFQNSLGNMDLNVLDWQKIGHCGMSFDEDEHEPDAFEMTRRQYRKLLGNCFSDGQCQLCCKSLFIYGRDQQLVCEDCKDQHLIGKIEECQLCHKKQGKVVKSIANEDYSRDKHCKCRAHAMCWLNTFHNAKLELERETCEMCQEPFMLSDSDDSEEEYYDAIEEEDDAYEPASKRRRLE